MYTKKYLWVVPVLLCMTVLSNTVHAEAQPGYAHSLPDTTSDMINDITLQGYVYTSDTHEPLSGVTIRIDAFSVSTSTGQDGFFTLHVPAQTDPITFRFSHIGFRSLVKTFALTELQEPLRIYLSPEMEILSPVTVLSYRSMKSPALALATEHSALLPIDSGAFLRDAGNASGIRRGGFGIDPVIRGMSGSRLNVRVDGMTTTAAACPNRMDPPTAHVRLTDIERIEIHRGPHALQYGPSFGGTVNFVSHKPDLTAITSLNGDYRAGFETNTGHRKTDLRLQAGNLNWDLLLNGGLSATDDYKSGHGVSIPAGFNSADYGLEVGKRFRQNHRVSAGWSQSFVRNADFPSLGMDMAVDDTYKIKTSYQWEPENKDFIQSLSINGYWSLVDHEMNNHNRDSYMMRDAVALAETRSYGAHLKTGGLFESGRWSLTTGVDRQNVEGTRYVDFKMGPRTGDSMTYNLWQDATITNMGIFTGIERYLGNWTLSLGARADLNLADANDPAPRFQETDVSSHHFNLSVSSGITRMFSENSTIGFFMGRGTRSPDITERFINYLTIGRDGYEYAGNPGLKPETNNQADLVFQSRLNRFQIESTLFISYMTSYISGVIDPDSSPVGMDAPGVRLFQNRGNALFTGFEADVSYDLLQNLYLSLNASYTKAEYRDDQAPVAEIPPFEATLNIGGSLFSGKIIHEVNLRRTFTQNRFDEAFGEDRTPAFFLVDLNLSAQLLDGVSLSGGVRNLLDESYYEHLNRRFNPGVESTSDYLLEPGRSFFLELSVRF